MTTMVELTAPVDADRAAPAPVPTGDDFAAYVAERRPVLLRMARAITGDRDTAEDLLQSALVSVLPRWGTLRSRAAADAYVRRTMVNRHHSWYRQPWRRRELPVPELPDPPAPVAVADPMEIADTHDSVWALVSALPERQRATLVLRFYEGLSERETALALGTSLGTVKSNTSRALASLRRGAMADEGCQVGWCA